MFFRPNTEGVLQIGLNRKFLYKLEFMEIEGSSNDWLAVNFEIFIWGAKVKSLLTIFALKPNSTIKATIITAIPTAIEAIPSLVTVAEKVSEFGFCIRWAMK